jgi:membrane protein YdbS with pleckstrin-like domain
MDLGFTLAKDETVLRKVNRHWIVLVPVAVSSAVAILIAIAITYLFGRYRSSFPASMTGVGLGVFDIIMVVFALALFYAGYWVYCRNFLVLTNQHLVRVEQKGLFSHAVSQLALARVQDVAGAVPGFMATVLGYGNLTVETAGAEDNFVFTNIYAPADVASVCLKAHEAYTPSVEASGDGETPLPVAPVAAAPIPPSEMPIPAVPVPAPIPVEPPAPEPAPTPEAVLPPLPPEPIGPQPLAESVTAAIEHHDQ